MKRPFAFGEAINARIIWPPLDSPKTRILNGDGSPTIPVILLGSPPKNTQFVWTHLRASMVSCSPILTVGKPGASRNPRMPTEVRGMSGG